MSGTSTSTSSGNNTRVTRKQTQTQQHTLMPSTNQPTNTPTPQSVKTVDIKSDFAVTINNFTSEINAKLEDIKNYFLQKIADLEAKISEKFSVKLTELSNCVSEFETRIDNLERNLSRNDLVLNGIPYERGENLPVVFNTICTSLETPVPAVNTVYRTRSKTGNKDSSIIIKLNNVADKINILRTISNNYKQHRKTLTLRDAGFDSHQRIFLHENLTKRNYLIYREAHRMRRLKQIASVFTSNGSVYIKGKPDGNAQLITNRDDLTAFAATG